MNGDLSFKDMITEGTLSGGSPSRADYTVSGFLTCKSTLNIQETYKLLRQEQQDPQKASIEKKLPCAPTEIVGTTWVITKDNQWIFKPDFYFGLVYPCLFIDGNQIADSEGILTLTNKLVGRPYGLPGELIDSGYGTDTTNSTVTIRYKNDSIQGSNSFSIFNCDHNFNFEVLVEIKLMISGLLHNFYIKKLFITSYHIDISDEIQAYYACIKQELSKTFQDRASYVPLTPTPVKIGSIGFPYWPGISDGPAFKNLLDYEKTGPSLDLNVKDIDL